MEERVNQNIQNIMGDNGYILDTINESYDQASSIPSQQTIGANDMEFDKLDQMIEEHQDRDGANIPAESQPKSSLYTKVNNFMPERNESFMRQQSMIDPDKKHILMNYDLDEFKNSMWENFLGSQVQISKLVEADGSYRETNCNVDKMGPVQLRIEEGSLYQAWEKSRRSVIDGFKGEREGQSKVLETWVCRPPNVMMFQINRVDYDFEKQKLIKDNGRFDFEKTIYLDLFLK